MLSKPSSSKMTEAFRREFAACLQLKRKAPMEHYQLLMEILEEHKLKYVLQEVHPKFFLVHLANRDYLMMTPSNAHKRGADIKACGADLQMLTNAVCMELSESGPRRADHIAKNEALVKRAEGILAPLNGQERFITIGCGHTSQFCKQADLGGDTCEPSLQIPGTTQIDKQALFSNANFRTMITKGWSWTVVHSAVDEEFPRFAEIAQAALNVRNHSSSSMGELEVSMTLAKHAKECSRAEAVDWIDRLRAPCKSYAGVLLDYVVSFGGGDDSFIIQFVDSVSKQFNANVALGESYWSALAYTEFHNKTSKYPLVRAALLLANLTSDKIEDGYARLLKKSDVKIAAAEANAKASARSEEVLQEALSIAQAVSSIEKCLKPLGQLFVRVGLKLVGAEMKGRESKSYTMRQICQACTKGVAQVVGSPVRFDKWDNADDDSDLDEPKAKASKACAKSKASPGDAPAVLVTLGDHTSHAWICSQAGFSVGSQVKEKKMEASPDHLYVIFEIGDGTVSLHQVCSYINAPRKVSVTVPELLSNWSVSTMEPPVAMLPVPALPDVLNEQLKRNEIFKVILDLHNKHMKNYDQLVYYRRPDLVRANSFIKAGALVLVPIVPAGNIFYGVKPGSITVGECCLMPAAKPQIQEQPDVWAKNAVVNGYWWVNKTSDQKLVNMTEAKVTVKDLAIPIIKNSCDIEPFTRLCIYAKPKAVAVPLSNAKVMSDADNSDENVDAAASNVAAKAKAKAKRAAKAGQPAASGSKKRGRAQ